MLRERKFVFLLQRQCVRNFFKVLHRTVQLRGMMRVAAKIEPASAAFGNAVRAKNVVAILTAVFAQREVELHARAFFCNRVKCAPKFCIRNSVNQRNVVRKIPRCEMPIFSNGRFIRSSAHSRFR